MKTILKFSVIVLLSALGFSCEKETASLNQLAKDLFCFKEGSVWVYYDSISKATDTMTIIYYKESKLCGLKGAYRSASCGELIRIAGTFLRDFDISLTTIGYRRSNTANIESFKNKDENQLLFIFTCDENNNFDVIDGSVTFLQTYQLNEDIYANVYLFEVKNSKYYIAQNVGAIRVIKTSIFDYVLINKNLKQ